jgi:excisionase family DNA binding protein
MERDELLTAPEVAEVFGVHIDTVRGWIKAGLLGHVRLPGRSQRVPRSEVDRFLQVHGGRP